MQPDVRNLLSEEEVTERLVYKVVREQYDWDDDKEFWWFSQNRTGKTLFLRGRSIDASTEKVPEEVYSGVVFTGKVYFR